MSADERPNAPASANRRPLGWFIGLGVLLITLGVVLGLVGIGFVALRQQRHRIDPAPAPAENTGTNSR